MEQTAQQTLEGNPRQPLLDLLSDPSPIEHWDIYRMIELQDHIRNLSAELDHALYGSQDEDDQDYWDNANQHDQYYG